MKAQKNTKIMVTCALLVALQVILARFLSINTTFVVVNFSFLAEIGRASCRERV